jgi:hypothetical protein
MPLNIAFEPIRIAADTDHADEQARLVLIDGRLAGVLTLLQEEIHAAEHRGRWFLEAAFGNIAERTDELLFTTLDEASNWFQEKCCGC